MSSLADWIKYELNPAIYEQIEAAFPELRFTRTARGEWNSPKKLDGSEPREPRRDKTVITPKRPGILEQGGDYLSFVDYVIKRDGSDLIGALRTLAQVTGLSLPNREDFNPEEYKKRARSLSIMETANSYYCYLIRQPEASAVIDYLSGRGYSPEDIDRMELGYLPSQDRLIAHLVKNGFSREDIETALSLSKDTRIGSSHRLTIPYRSGGSITGFKYRTTGSEIPKYINSSGLDRSSGFFNLSPLKGDKDLVIVEGELDALHATAKGLENIVASGGSNITEAAIADAIKRGARRFTICFDKEPGKEKSKKQTRTAIELILKQSSQVFIAELPDLGGDKTDPDRVIKELGPEGLREVISGAIPYYTYETDHILTNYGELQEQQSGTLTHKQTEDLIRELVAAGSRIKDPLHKALNEADILGIDALTSLGLTKDRLQEVIREQEEERLQQQQKGEAEKILRDGGRLITEGKIAEGLEQIRDRLRDVSTIAKGAEFSKYLIPNNLEEVGRALRDKPPGLQTRYRIGEVDLTYPAGALSFIAAGTGHGKTTFLINSILQVVEDNRDRNKTFHFFTFEESAEAITRNMLNTFAGVKLNNGPGGNRGAVEALIAGSDRFVGREYHSSSLSHYRVKEQQFKDLLSSGRLAIHYTDYSSDELIGLISYLHSRQEIGGIFIDYMQLLHKGRKGRNKYNSRQEELKDICLELKDIAVKTGLPIVLGAQFNREVVNPLLLHTSKIGEAGDIERIAGLIIGLWDTNKTPIVDKKDEDRIKEKGSLLYPGQIYAKILKNRTGKSEEEDSFKYDSNLGKIYPQEEAIRPGGAFD
ncbi:MAG: DnaB-like helicase C-terminal domain-containing protein [Bacteroidota bacterium]|jgi:DNA primase catalytic core